MGLEVATILAESALAAQQETTKGQPRMTSKPALKAVHAEVRDSIGATR